MKKKIVSLLMATTMVAGLLSGCGGNSNTPPANDSNANNSANADNSAAADNSTSADNSASADNAADANTDASGDNSAASGLPEMTTEEITLT